MTALKLILYQLCLFLRDIMLYRRTADDPRGWHLQRIHETHPHYDPLHYVLLFPYGHEGFRIGIPYNGIRRGQVSVMHFYAYRFMVRDETNTILRGGRLFQQYVVDQYSKMEMQRLRYIRMNQNVLRAEVYQGLSDAVTAGDDAGVTVGSRVILPATFIGSPRSMIELYQDAMAIARKYGKPDLFVTFTCNPSWVEITRELMDGQTAADRPDLVARVFKIKLSEFMKDIKTIFGQVLAYVRVTEFQKRGLPHAHILIIISHDAKPRTVQDVDKIVSAEIPDQPYLRELVEKHMSHGPCGIAFPNAPCMNEKGECSKKFPKQFSDQTKLTETTYPEYKRRDDGKTVSKGGANLDNRFVVPYNRYLLEKYQSHINVEVCNSITAVKYLYKYVYKGHDRVMVEFQAGQNDEVQKYVDARYVSASEACWRIFHFELQDRYPSIQRLALHLPDQQTVVYREGEAQNAVQNPKPTTLTAWFEANYLYPQASELLYHEMPEHFTWDNANRKWKPRQTRLSIGRMYNAWPSEGERFYLRLLLQHVKGALSFPDIRTLDTGEVCSSFREACLRRGLLEDDDEWRVCLQETAFVASAVHLRKLFAVILTFCEPSEPILLWNMFKPQMCDDFTNQGIRIEDSESMALLHIKQLIGRHRRTLAEFDLPEPLAVHDIQNRERFDPVEEGRKASNWYAMLNADQAAAFHRITNSIESDDEFKLFFVDAPGGCGKTFLYNTLLSHVRSRDQCAIAVASSGIAADLLEGGQTAHSMFKIPIPIKDNSMCNIKRQTQLAQKIRSASLIVWDEAPMMDRRVFECVSRSMCDILNDPHPFGGKVVVLGGDFRQILPVIKHGSEADVIPVTLNKSILWHNIQILRLTQNMRAIASGPEFHQWLKKIGDGDEVNYNDVGKNAIRLPHNICLPPNDPMALIASTFPSLQENRGTEGYLEGRAILTTTNDLVEKINATVIQTIRSPVRDYFSADSIEETEQPHLYPTEFLNSLSISGLPPHKLSLQENSPIMLLRNLDAKSGLLNGTRLVVIRLGDRVIEAKILSGRRKNDTVFIPRITLTPSDTDLPFKFKRRQFPVRQCYALTINKAQGQTLENVGIYLPEPVFSHGQLYVALSRCKSFEGIKVSVAANNIVDESQYTDNIVYRSVLETT